MFEGALTPLALHRAGLNPKYNIIVSMGGTQVHAKDFKDFKHKVNKKVK